MTSRADDHVAERFRLDSGPDGPKTKTTKIAGLAHGAAVTDDGLKHVKGLTSLKDLRLSTCEITNAGLEHLNGLTNLEYLDLFQTPITDAGLIHLKRLTKLKYLHLGRTLVSDAGANVLKQAWPDCKIYHVTGNIDEIRNEIRENRQRWVRKLRKENSASPRQ